MDYTQNYHSPLGEILLASDGENLTGLWFQDQQYYADTLSGDSENRDLPVFRKVREWLNIYFSGRDPGFTPPISVNSTDFRMQVWDILLRIPYGETRSYGEIAEEIARQNDNTNMSAQAVGGAVGHNPIALIIPCHRVIGTDGSLIGYGGGLERKQALLDLESSGMKNDAGDEAFEVFEEMCRELHGLND